jgi:hypothetical protein
MQKKDGEPSFYEEEKLTIEILNSLHLDYETTIDDEKTLYQRIYHLEKGLKIEIKYSLALAIAFYGVDALPLMLENITSFYEEGQQETEEEKNTRREIINDFKLEKNNTIRGQ